MRGDKLETSSVEFEVEREEFPIISSLLVIFSILYSIEVVPRGSILNLAEVSEMFITSISLAGSIQLGISSIRILSIAQLRLLIGPGP